MKRYQVYITSNSQAGKMNRFSFSSLHIRLLIGFCATVLVALSLLIVDYSLSVSQKEELTHLRTENLKLNEHVQAITKQVHGLEFDLQKIEDFSFKLKTITNHSGTRLPASGIGPLPSHYYYNDSKREAPSLMNSPSFQYNERESRQDLLLEDHDDQVFMMQKLDQLKTRGAYLLNDIWATLGILEENKHLLKTTPSMWPTRGRVSSRFGYRKYPVRAGRNSFASASVVADFHGGLDIAATIGTQIIAPADGLVVSAGKDRRTGNYIIIDHGYDLETVYGHLDQIHVQRNQEVNRGDLIGTVGNTGQTTGPHLHYEVRISNRPVNPEHYIFN